MSPWDGGQGTYLQADCTFEGINCPVEDQIHLFHSVFLCLYSKYVCCKPVICTFFSRPVVFYSVWLSGSAGWSVSGSEHVVVFSFVMPWVLWTSWGRYHMEGNQESDSGPANRLHGQVLENSCYHRASQGCTSVQSPQSGLNMDSKSSLISQFFFFFFCLNICVCFQWNLYQFGDSVWLKLYSPSLNELCNSYAHQSLKSHLKWLNWLEQVSHVFIFVVFYRFIYVIYYFSYFISR